MPQPARPFAALPTLTVAVCTRDRPEQLARALASLAAQASPPEEVLVVHNAPGDDRGGLGDQDGRRHRTFDGYHSRRLSTTIDGRPVAHGDRVATISK